MAYQIPQGLSWPSKPFFHRYLSHLRQLTWRAHFLGPLASCCFNACQPILMYLHTLPTQFPLTTCPTHFKTAP